LLIDIFEKLCKKPRRLAQPWPHGDESKYVLCFKRSSRFLITSMPVLKSPEIYWEIVGKNHLEYPGKKYLLGCTNPGSTIAEVKQHQQGFQIVFE
jgi:hypothetical protein